MAPEGGATGGLMAAVGLSAEAAHARIQKEGLGESVVACDNSSVNVTLAGAKSSIGRSLVRSWLIGAPRQAGLSFATSLSSQPVCPRLPQALACCAQRDAGGRPLKLGRGVRRPGVGAGAAVRQAEGGGRVRARAEHAGYRVPLARAGPLLRAPARPCAPRLPAGPSLAEAHCGALASAC